MKNNLTRFGLFLSLFMLCLLNISSPLKAAEVKDVSIRTPDEILSEFKDTIPSTAAILELFINASEWDAVHQPVRDSSMNKLAELGHDILPPIYEKYLSSTDVRRRITVDDLSKKIGYSASQHLLSYLKSADAETRRHAAYLLGDTSFASSQQDPLVLGPFKEDFPAAEALLQILKIEKDSDVLRSVIYGIGKMRNPQLIPDIVPFLNHKDEPIRLNTAVALGCIPHADSAVKLIKTFNDPLGSVRQAAIISLSSPAMGSATFDVLIDAIHKQGDGSRAQLCCLDSLARYLRNAKSSKVEVDQKNREKAFDPAYRLLLENSGESSWLLRGYIVSVLGFTQGHPEVADILTKLKITEKHPFVIGRINQALLDLKD